MNWRIGFVAVAIVSLAFTAVAWRAANATYVVGFWYEEFPFTFGESVTKALGGPLTAAEIDAIKIISRNELTRAFSGLNLAFSERREAFWTVRVQQSLERRRRQPLPNAGETFLLGPLGGRSRVHFTELVFAALAHAPAGATRQMLIEGIGRGVGRAAVHEVAHAILGVTGSMDNRTDADSYEYFTHNRPAQYYGELHWAHAWPVLVQRIR